MRKVSGELFDRINYTINCPKEPTGRQVPAGALPLWSFGVPAGGSFSNGAV